MAVRIYRWKPDTCSCIINETHDDVAGTWTGSPEFKCSFHAGVADNALYGVLMTNADSEQKRKNGVHKELLENATLALGQLTVDPRGGGTSMQFKNGINWAWAFNGGRVLEISITGVAVSVANKNILHAILDARFGAGKVTVL